MSEITETVDQAVKPFMVEEVEEVLNHISKKLIKEVKAA